MKHRILVYPAILFTIFFLFFSACSPTTPAPTPDTRPVATRILASPNPSTPTLPPPTETPNPTPTITISPAPASATPNPIPTPPGDDAMEQVLWLFDTNNGCQLPCWWGITPGETEWPVAEEFLSTFVLRIDRSLSTPASTSQPVGYEPVVPLPTTVFWEERTRLGIVARNGIVEFINARVPVRDRPPGYLTAYLLPEFLKTYGRPTEVWLSTYPAAQGQNDLPFVVVLFYPNQGIAALFIDNGIRQGDMVRGCPQQGPVRFLSLWHLPLNYTLADLQRRSGVYNADFLTLEEATAMDVNTFYETFKDAENTACLETPAVLW